MAVGKVRVKRNGQWLIRRLLGHANE